MKWLWNLVKDRLREPSTWAGLASLAASAGVITAVQAAALTNLIPTLSEHLPALIAAGSGVVAVFLPERGSKGAEGGING